MTRNWMGIVCLSAGLAAAPLLVSAAPQATLEEGNAFYEKGEWDAALESYTRLTRQNFESPELFLNMGNTYFRKGERGKAALWYERALRLSPRDGDIAFNLQLTRSHLKDASRPILDQVVFFFTDRELGTAVLILSWAFFGFLFVRFIKEGNVSPAWSNLTWISGACLILAGGWFAARSVRALQPLGVVTTPPGEVRNGPGLDYPVGFTVPEGTRVDVLKKRLAWWQVGVPDQGLKGWLPTEQVDLITSETAN